MKSNINKILSVFLALILIFLFFLKEYNQPNFLENVKENPPIEVYKNNDTKPDLQVKPLILNEEKLPEDTASEATLLPEIPGQIDGTEINYQNIFNAVNQERHKAGIPILKRSETLDLVASHKLQDMLKYNYWSHTNPETKTDPWYWFEVEKYEFNYAGENLARKFDSVQDMVAGWMDSPTHKKNIMKSDFVETGIAFKGNLVIQVFGTKKKTIKN